jgi:hypothetical protein
MRLVTLFLIAAFATSTVDAASYQKTDGTIVDPIRLTHGGPHSYSGVNLESGENLTGADLTGADLNGANLTNANLTGANLTGADLNGADLNGSTSCQSVLLSVGESLPWLGRARLAALHCAVSLSALDGAGFSFVSSSRLDQSIAQSLMVALPEVRRRHKRLPGRCQCVTPFHIGITLSF